MARDFAGNQNLNWGDIPAISDASVLSYSAWIWNDAVITNMTYLDNRGATGDGLLFFMDDEYDVKTDIYRIFVQAADNQNCQMRSVSNAAVAGSWQHIFWSFLADDAAGIQLWVNGSEDADSPEETLLVDDVGQVNDGITMGENIDGDHDFDGKMAEVAFWNRVLSDAEIISLSKGYSPLFFPSGLIFYSTLMGRNSPEIDIIGGTTGTVTGATAYAHPPMIYPAAPMIVTAPAAAVGAEFELLIGAGGMDGGYLGGSLNPMTG